MIMFYKKRLNNNVVVALDTLGKERILCGKGLGYQMVEGERVDETKVEKTFTLKDSLANHRLQELFQTIPIEYVELAEEIVTYAKIHIDNGISDNAIVSLCDHIYMAIKRRNEDIEVKNVMLWDIQKFYRDEYTVGKHAITLIQEKFNIYLNDDEAGFIALHIVNSQLDMHKDSVQKLTQVMQEIETIIRMSFAITLDETSVYYYRFVTHLKFFAQRLFSGHRYEGGDIDSMLNLVKEKYKKECACVEKISQFLKQKYEYSLSEEEVLYLSIHIARIIQVSK